LEPSVLRRWRSLANGTAAGVTAVRPASAVTTSAEQTEIRHLRRELERV